MASTPEGARLLLSLFGVHLGSAWTLLPASVSCVVGNGTHVTNQSSVTSHFCAFHCREAPRPSCCIYAEHDLVAALYAGPRCCSHSLQVDADSVQLGLSSLSGVLCFQCGLLPGVLCFPCVARQHLTHYHHVIHPPVNAAAYGATSLLVSACQVVVLSSSSFSRAWARIAWRCCRQTAKSHCDLPTTL
jgi:hypothetical protein